jgi:hypothetical protein
MAEGKRFGLSAMQKSDMWCRWKMGQSLHEIGRAFGKSHSSIRCVALHHGGFVPAVRQRSLLSLTLTEREEIKSLTQPILCSVNCDNQPTLFLYKSPRLSWLGHSSMTFLQEMPRG